MCAQDSVQTSSVTNLTACELLVECSRNLQDRELWSEFYTRFRRKILTYLMRAYRMSGGRSEDFVRYADDWLQDVFMKLIRNEGHIIRSFRGTTDLSAYAFIASIAISTVADQMRAQRAIRRRAKVVPFQEEQEAHSGTDSRISALLDLIDIEKVLQTDNESKNPDRDLLIFKLHFVEGLTAREIALVPALNLTTSGLEKVLSRLRNRLARRQSG